MSEPISLADFIRPVAQSKFPNDFDLLEADCHRIAELFEQGRSPKAVFAALYSEDHAAGTSFGPTETAEILTMLSFAWTVFQAWQTLRDYKRSRSDEALYDHLYATLTRAGVEHDDARLLAVDAIEARAKRRARST